MSDSVRKLVDIYGNDKFPITNSDAVMVGDITLTKKLEDMDAMVLDHLIIKSPNGTLFKIGATDEGKFKLTEILPD